MLLECPHCGQTYNPGYMRYCARCGEAVPDKDGKVARPGPMDGLGARGGTQSRKPVSEGSSPEPEPPAEDWQPSQAVADMVTEYRNQLNQTPEDHTTRYALALAYVFARQWEQAREQLQQVVHAMPDYADAHYRLAVCQARLGDRSKARDSARQAAHLEPENAQHKELLAKLEGSSRNGG